MEMNSNTYRRIKVFLSKIQCGIVDLEKIREKITLSYDSAVLSYRVNALRNIGNKLTNCICDSEISSIYLPPGRCKSINSWYGATKLYDSISLPIFFEHLTLADTSVINQANFIVSDINTPNTILIEVEKFVIEFKLLIRPVKMDRLQG